MTSRIQNHGYVVGYPDSDEEDDVNLAPRGWSMRKGHRRRLAREDDSESVRGRARYSQSVGKGGRRYRSPDNCMKTTFRIRNQFTYQQQKSMASEAHEALRESSEQTEHEYASLMPALISYRELCGMFLIEDADQEEGWDAAAMSEEAWSSSWSSDSCRDPFSDDDASTASETAIACNVSGQSKLKSNQTSIATGPEEKVVPWRWQLAQERAERTAREYSKSDACKKLRQRRMELDQAQNVTRSRRQKRPIEDKSACARRPAALSTAPRLHQPPPYGGAPSNMTLHEKARSFARPPGLGVQVLSVLESSSEYKAVTAYFRHTLGMSCEVVINSLSRIENHAVQSRVFLTGGVTVMFHGCRSSVNEERIMEEGFKVSRCSSGGSGFGTWFAYNASYSNGGYAFNDSLGWRHMFICIVSYHHTVYDSSIMRVVGQDCAYPQWLIQYQIGSQAPRPQNIAYVVEDGRWVPKAH